MFSISEIFSIRSVSDSCMLFICVVFVSIRLTYCSFRFSVSSNFIVISLCIFSGGGGFDLFLIDVHNYSCVLKRCFL